MAQKKSPVGGQGDSNEAVNMYYSNAVRISHSLFEFLMDFAMAIPEQQGKAAIQARIIVSPQHMKALFFKIGENIQTYESTNGPIMMPGDKPDIDSFLDDVMGGGKE